MGVPALPRRQRAACRSLFVRTDIHVIAAIAVRGLELTTDALYNLSDDYEALRAELDELRLLISELTQRVAALEAEREASKTP